jgi:cell division protein FtsW
MPTAAARRPPSSRASQRRRDRGRAGKSAAAAGQQTLEHRILLTATLCLLALGAVMVYSSSSATTLLQGHGNGTGYLVKFVAYGAIGLVLMHLLARDGVAKVQRLLGPLLAVSFALVLAVHVPHIGVTVNGARRWIGPGSLQFQPSELLKLALVLYTATLLAGRSGAGDVASGAGRARLGGGELTRPLLVVVGGGCLLVATEPDLGTAMVIAFTTGALLVAAGVSLRTLALVTGCVLGLVAVYAIARPYARARLTSFLDPWGHASGSGFQAVQGQIAIGSGGFLGVGPGQSVQKIFYLPAAPTDFIFAVIAEELGVVGVCALLFLYGLIAYAGLRAARAARSLYSSLIAVGATALILSQAILNVFAVLGLAPLTGVPLPFVSYGSSSLIVMLATMGLLLNVAAGRGAHVRVVAPSRRRRRRRNPGSGDAGTLERAGWSGDGRAEEDRDSRRRYRWARGAGPGGGRRAAS